MNWIKLIPVKYLVSKLPSILAYILTKVLTYIFEKHPVKSEYVIGQLEEISTAIKTTIDSAKDGKITEKELLLCRDRWERAFKF